LRDGVQQLTGALRSAISDGTVTKFGEAIATAFRGAVQWAKNFAASFDWKEVTAGLQSFAGQAQQAFTSIGQWATNAGNVVKTVWGVMTAGVNTALMAIYGVAAAVSAMASKFIEAQAMIQQGMAKITFGDVSKRFAESAAEMRVQAGAVMAVSEAFAEKAKQSFDSMAAGAQLARDGFTGLTDAANQTAAPIAKTTAALDGTSKSAETAAQKTKQAADAQAALAKKADESRAAMLDLQNQYNQAIKTGDLQRATTILVKLKTATDEAAKSQSDLAREAQDAAARVAAAFEAAGIQTKEQLSLAAKSAKEDFDLIAASGQATAQGLATAWKRAADAAIAANNGIVPGWVQAEAAARGYTVAADEAGRATLKTADAATDATTTIGDGWRGVTHATNEAIAAADEYNRRSQHSSGGELGPGVERIGSGFRNKDGWASDAKGNTIGAVRQNWLGVYNFVKQMGLDDDQARSIADQAYDQNGNYSSGLQKSQMRSQWDSIDVLEAARRAAEKIIRQNNSPAAASKKQQQADQQAAPPDSTQPPRSRDDARRQPASSSGASASDGRAQSSVQEIRVKLNLNGRDYGQVDTSRSGAASIEEFLRALQNDARRAGAAS
jgi:hypothetical protein